MQSNLSSKCRGAFKKRKLSFVLAVILGYRLMTSGTALALPQGGVVTSGNATITYSTNVTTINQSTNKASINWPTFSTKPTETVNFNQPSASSITLNRVIGNEKSVLEGALNANGKVFLINSNGVLFTKGSTVNTAGLVASTLNLTDEDFNAGNYVFKANGSTGSIINLGTITVKDGGYVALLGNSVSNQGVITATKGTVSLNSGDKITLNFNGDSLVSVTIDEGTLNALVENKEAIYADGGSVTLTAKAADDLLSAQVNNSGLIQARTIGDLKGNINLHAYGGTAKVDGTLDASAPVSGDGGTIETSGNKVKIADSAVITTKSVNGKNGTWLINSDGFTIGTDGDMTGTALTNALALGNVNIASTSGNGSDGNINVNQAVTWSADTNLTLTATNDININKSITATGANAGLTLTAGTDININAPVTLSGANAALAMTYGGAYNILTKASYSGATIDSSGYPATATDTSGGVYGSITLSGANASLKINGNTYTLIHSMSQLDLLDGYNSVTGTGTAATLSGYYALAQDLDASGTTYTSSLIGTLGIGTLTGLGHTVSNLTISAGSTSNVGLIGKTATGATTTIRDIGLESVNISTTGTSVGALLGNSYGGLTISQAYSTGAVSGGGSVGGLIGKIFSNSAPSSIINSYSNANVTSTGNTNGGLVGYAVLTSINNSHATGSVTSSGTQNGGLVGTLTKGSVSRSYAKGDVTAPDKIYAGGLIGYLNGTSATTAMSVTNSFATGNVTGGYYVGGLIGYTGGNNTYAVAVDNCYASGKSVTGTLGTLAANGSGGIGGLIGWAAYTNISNSHATGKVTAAISDTTATQGVYQRLDNIGGLVGSLEHGSINNSYATGDVTGSVAANGGVASWSVGGLVGSATRSSISNSHATGNVIGRQYVGGLVGSTNGAIINSWASGNVSGWMFVGGLAGTADSSSITNSHATGNITGIDYTYYDAATGTYKTIKSARLGGLVGRATRVAISGSYATGSVTGGSAVGGLVGELDFGSIANSYASGKVTGASDSVGGLVGEAVTDSNEPTTITNSYYNKDSTGQNKAVGTTDDSLGGSTTTTNTGGLTNKQFTDIQHYLDGTIDQVLADRAVQAAYQADASNKAGSTIGHARQDQIDQPILSAKIIEQQQPSVENHIVYADSADYSTDIKAINADGVEYDLEEKPSKTK